MIVVTMKRKISFSSLLGLKGLNASVMWAKGAVKVDGVFDLIR